MKMPEITPEIRTTILDEISETRYYDHSFYEGLSDEIIWELYINRNKPIYEYLKTVVELTGTLPTGGAVYKYTAKWFKEGDTLPNGYFGWDLIDTAKITGHRTVWIHNDQYEYHRTRLGTGLIGLERI